MQIRNYFQTIFLILAQNNAQSFVDKQEKTTLMQNHKSDYIMIDKMGFSYYQVNATKTQINWSK